METDMIGAISTKRKVDTVQIIKGTLPLATMTPEEALKLAQSLVADADAILWATKENG